MEDSRLFLSKQLPIFTGIVWLAWIALNAMVLYLSSSILADNKFSTFFPVNYMDAPGLWSYDVSEFVVYGFVVPLFLYVNVKYYHKHSKAKYVKAYDIALSVFVAFSFVLVVNALWGDDEVAKGVYVILRGCFNVWLGVTFADAIFDLFKIFKF